MDQRNSIISLSHARLRNINIIIIINFSKIKTEKFGSKEENRNDFLVTSFVHVELLQI